MFSSGVSLAVSGCLVLQLGGLRGAGGCMQPRAACPARRWCQMLPPRRAVPPKHQHMLTQDGCIRHARLVQGRRELPPLLLIPAAGQRGGVHPQSQALHQVGSRDGIARHLQGSSRTYHVGVGASRTYHWARALAASLCRLSAVHYVAVAHLVA